MSYRCDSCGKHVNEKEFEKGATREYIGAGLDNDWETICAKCNKEFEKEYMAA